MFFKDNDKKEKDNTKTRGIFESLIRVEEKENNKKKKRAHRR